MPITNRVKTGLCILFFASLAAEPIAAALSPQFPAFMAEFLRWGKVSPAQQEALRRATPMWSRMVGIYNTVLYKIHVSGNSNIAVMGQDGFMFLGNIHIGHSVLQFAQNIHLPRAKLQD